MKTYCALEREVDKLKEDIESRKWIQVSSNIVILLLTIIVIGSL